MKLGEWGENQAVKYLERNGYKIIETNFRCKLGEIDIIAAERDCLCFVEVKTRRTLTYGMPREAITKTKLKHILNSAKYYVLTNQISDIDLRIDAIEILYLDDQEYISHTMNIS